MQVPKDVEMLELEEIQNTIQGASNLDLRKKGRRFMMRGNLDRLVRGTILRPYHVYLFNDVIIYTEIASKTKKYFKYVSHKQLKDCLFIDYADSKALRYAFEILHTDEKKRFTFVAKNLENKIAWKQNVENQINKSIDSGENYNADSPYGFFGSYKSPPHPNPRASGMYEEWPQNIIMGAAMREQSQVNLLTSSTVIVGSVGSEEGSVGSPGGSVGLMTESPVGSGLSDVSDSNNSWSASADEESFEDEGDVITTQQQEKESVMGVSDDGTPIVKAATVNTIAWFLVYGDYSDTSLIHSFLFAYRAFSTPQELFSNLLQIYNLEGTPPKELPIKYSKYDTRKRVTAFLKIWLENFFFRDFDVKGLYQQVLDFLKIVNKNGQKEESNLIKLTILRVNKNRLEKRNRRRKNKLHMSVTSPNLKLANSVSNANVLGSPTATRNPTPMGDIKFSDLNVSSVAEQLTLIEFSTFQKVQLSEFAKMAWKAHTAKKLAPNILALIERFNVVSQWVSTEIVMSQSLKHRAYSIERFVQLAQKCVELKNFNTLMEMLAGLNRGSVQRLKKTWNAVSQSIQETFQELNTLMDPKQNFKNYREALRRSSQPCLPYFGMYLRDITFIEEGNSDKYEDLVNFEKIQLLGKMYKEVQHFQRGRYYNSFAEDDTLQSFLRKLLVTPEELLYKHSQQVEPSNAHADV